QAPIGRQEIADRGQVKAGCQGRAQGATGIACCAHRQGLQEGGEEAQGALSRELESMLSPDQIAALTDRSAAKMDAMSALIRSCGSAIVAFSGGVDSTLVLRVARDVLGDRAVALTALSPSVPEEEENEARRLASSLGVRHLIVRSNELANAEYVRNASNRCYFCKTELYDLCEQKR